MDLVDFDPTGMLVYPNSPAKVDGGVVNHVSLSYLAPALPAHLSQYYKSSVVEFKAKDDNYMRQAILASASLQGVNRLLRLKGVVNYAFSIHGMKGDVDVIVSTWREDDNNVSIVSLNLRHCHSSVGLGFPLSLQDHSLSF